MRVKRVCVWGGGGKKEALPHRNACTPIPIRPLTYRMCSWTSTANAGSFRHSGALSGCEVRAGGRKVGAPHLFLLERVRCDGGGHAHGAGGGHGDPHGEPRLKALVDAGGYREHGGRPHQRDLHVLRQVQPPDGHPCMPGGGSRPHLPTHLYPSPTVWRRRCAINRWRIFPICKGRDEKGQGGRWEGFEEEEKIPGTVYTPLSGVPLSGVSL